MKTFRKGSIVALVFIALLVGGLGYPSASAIAQSNSRYFPETSHTVKGSFLAYWESHGGLAQQGYPLSDEFSEVSAQDNKPYIVQYFERAVFELHPEIQPPYDVRLSQLGSFRYGLKHPGGAAGQTMNSNNPRFFTATGFSVGGKFRAYWESHGGLAQQGYPISNEFQEVSGLNGKPYTVQYFERAVFELHPEIQPPYDVLLSQLGTYQIKQRYPGGAPNPSSSKALLLGVAMTSPTSGWAVGVGGTILQYDGASWIKESSSTTADLYGISMTAEDSGWAVGSSGTILQYANNAWHTIPSQTSAQIFSIDMISPTEGWAAGEGVLLHYHAGQWSAQSSPNSTVLYSISMVSETSGWAVGGRQGISTILQYSGGAWQAISSPTNMALSAVRMTGETSGWAVGSGGAILRYSNGGWTLVTSPSNANLTAMAMASATTGWAVGTDIVQYSAGSWAKAANPLDNSGTGLNGISMVSSSEGWAVGDGGIILHYQNGEWRKYNS